MSTQLPDLGPQALQSQLFRYAQDLQELMEQHSLLQQRYQTVLQSLGRASLNNDLLLGSVRYGLTPYLVTDSAGTISSVNACTEPLLGESGLDLRGVPILQLAPKSQHTVLLALIAQLNNMGGSSAMLYAQLDLFDGADIDSITRFDVLLVPQQNYAQLEFFWLLHPQTSGTRDVISALQQFDLIKDSANGLLVTDAEQRICATNAAFSQITGYEATEVMGQNPKMFSSGHHDNAFYEAFWTELTANGSWSGEFFNRRKDGQIYPDWKTIKVVKNVQGDTLAFVSVMTDTSHQYQDNVLLSRLAFHDALTGLPNRRLLEDRLAQVLSQAQRDGTGFSLFYMDLDRFKPINDDLGHEVGDLVLQEVSARLKKSVRQADTAARVGGDEFVILLQSAVRGDDVESIATNLLAKLSEPIAVGEQQLLIGASIGCARYPQDGVDIATLLKNADSAMYAAKRLGGNHFCFYESAGDHNALSNLGLDLWRALERQEMHVVYQPQVTAGGQLCGCEALLRWTHPVLGAVSPATFIPIAETNGAILPLGDWVLEAACRQLQAWQTQGLPAMGMSVNVSSRQLHDPDFVNRVYKTLLTTGVAPHSLELEITETDALQCDGANQYDLQALRALGVKIAIDDFGTGYSSLSRLKTLPVDRLKIDQSFVRDLASSPNARAISQCFVSMGMAMGMEVVAEGVETTEQHSVLTAQGCHRIQGYLTGRPMTAENLLVWFKHNQAVLTTGPATPNV